jgi:hypothetical protein
MRDFEGSLMRVSIASPHFNMKILSLLLSASSIWGSMSAFRSRADVGVVFSCCCAGPFTAVDKDIRV